MKHITYYIALVLFVCSFYSFQLDKNKTKNKYPLIFELEQLYKPASLPYYRDGVVEQESSYDRTGNNDDGFSGKYSYIAKEGNKLVLADLKGPGVINRIWTPTPTTDTIQFYIDGEKKPRISIPFIDLFSGRVFPFINPLCGNEVGGYYCYIPIQYSKSCKIMYAGERIQFHQIQYRTYTKGSEVQSFTMNWNEAEKASLKKACAYWNLQPDPLEQTKDFDAEVKIETKQFFLSPGENIPFFVNNQGGRIVGIEIDCGAALEGKNKDILLQARWEDDNGFAINSPAADFFGYAFGKQAMQSVLVGNSRGVNYCYMPMPFGKKAEIGLFYARRDGEQQPKIEVKTKVYYSPLVQNVAKEGRLYTVWRREIEPKEYEPYLFADIADKGHFVGVVHQAQGLNEGMTLFFEGDDSIVVDGRMRMHGTGSEDFYNGGWYALLDRWDRGVSLPVHGSLDYSLPMARTGGYRFFLADKMTFSTDMRLTIEHGPEQNKLPVDYTSVAFYYGSKPARSFSEPDQRLRTVYYPSTHVYYPQLMNLALGWQTVVENKGHLIAGTDGEGLVRIMLDEIPEGRYKVRLSYYETPDGASFSVWNRQKIISEWKDAYSEKEIFREKQEIGEVNVARHTNSLTIRIKKTDKGEKFHFQNLYLERK